MTCGHPCAMNFSLLQRYVLLYLWHGSALACIARCSISRASASAAQTAPAVSVIVGFAIYLKFIGQGSHESKNSRTSRVEWVCRRLEGSGKGLCHRVGGSQRQPSCANYARGRVWDVPDADIISRSPGDRDATDAASCQQRHRRLVAMAQPGTGTCLWGRPRTEVATWMDVRNVVISSTRTGDENT